MNSFTGQDRKIFRNLMTPPVAITSLNKTIFWTCLKSNMLFYADFGTQFLNKRLHLGKLSSCNQEVGSLLILSKILTVISPINQSENNHH